MAKNQENIKVTYSVAKPTPPPTRRRREGINPKVYWAAEKLRQNTDQSDNK